MDRLLSEQRVRDILDSNANPIEGRKALLKAQLAKADKEWMEWVGENIIELVLNFQMTEGNKENLLHMWQERKKEISRCTG